MVMTSLIVLAGLALLPFLLIVILRANAAITFMSVCLGSVLVNYTAADVVSIASGLASKPAHGYVQWVSLVLLVVPFVLALLFTRKNVKGGKQLLNAVPALATGLLFALLVIPLLAGSLQHQIEHQKVWHMLDDLQTAVILGGAFFSLLFLLVSHRHHSGEEKHGKH